MKGKALYGGLGFAAVLVVPIAFATTTGLEGFLRPFEYRDLSWVYERYSTIVDLFVYSLIFVGTAQAALGRRYEGRAGRVIAAGVGLSLAIGLAAAEAQFGFSLRSFGPLAALVLALLLGAMAYRVLRMVELSKAHSAAFSYILLFTALLGVSPELFRWVEDRASLLGWLLLALLAAAVATLFLSSLHSRGGGRILGRKVRRIAGGLPGRAGGRALMEGTARAIKRFLRPETREAASTSKAIGSDLDALVREVRLHGRDPTRIKALVSAVEGLRPKTEDLRRQIRSLRDVGARLRESDGMLFSQKRKELEGAAGKRDQSLLAREMKDEWERMGIENKTDRLEATLDAYAEEMSRHLESAAASLRGGNAKAALHSLQLARQCQRGVAELAAGIRALEKTLLGLAKGDVRIERHLNTRR